MRSFKRNRQWNVLESKPVLVFLGIVVLVFGWNVLRFYYKSAETARNKEAVEEEVAALREQKDNLLSDTAKLETDRGKEEFFRENFGLAKDGEEVVVIVEDKSPSPARQSSFSGFLSFFKNLFK